MGVEGVPNVNATVLSVIESRWNTTPFVKARTFLRNCKPREWLKWSACAAVAWVVRC
jgi:hypothetical protein